MRAALERARTDPKARAGGTPGAAWADRKARAEEPVPGVRRGDKGYVVCHATGLKMHWTDDPAENPGGYPKFEQGKIFTAVGRRVSAAEPRARIVRGQPLPERHRRPAGELPAGAGAVRPRVEAPDTRGSPRIVREPTAEHRAAAEQWAAASPVVPPDAAARYAENLSHALAALPAGVAGHAATALKHGGVRFHPDLKAVRAEAQRIGGKKAAGVVGFAHDRGMGTDLHLDDDTDPRGTYAHELWHAADNGGSHSADKGWLAVYTKEVVNRKASVPSLGRYALTNPAEGLAEYGRVLAERGEPYMAETFPVMTKTYA